MTLKVNTSNCDNTIKILHTLSNVDYRQYSVGCYSTQNIHNVTIITKLSFKNLYNIV